MPTLLTEDGFRFFFYSSEGNEPAHVHVQKGDAEGKIWLEPTFERVFMHGFTPQEEKRLIEIAYRKQGYFKKRWYAFFKQQL